MTRYFFTLLFLSGIFSAQAQTTASSGTIKGVVLDSASRQAAEFATISLQAADQRVVKTTLSKSNGAFTLEKLPAGDYLLTIASVGYTSKKQSVKLSTAAGIDLGTLLLGKSTHQLKAVTLQADRPLVKQEIDRISYDLQADPESKVNNVLDMMRKVPMLTVDAEENILLKGNSSYKILVNGKPSSMMERSPKDILRSMPASSIQRIEVITTPPSKYDADGLAGIINIITNKKVDNGYNGSVNVSERFPVGGPGTGGSFAFKEGKLGISAFGGGSISNTPETTSQSTRTSTGTAPTLLTQNMGRRSDGKSAYLGTEISFEIDSLNLLSTQLNLNGSRSTGNSEQTSLLTGSGSTLQQYLAENADRTTGSGFDAALNYQLGFRKNKNELLTFSYRYYGFDNDQNNRLAIRDRVAYTSPDYRQVNESSAGEHTMQVDYVLPAKRSTLEAGAKAILRDNNSDFEYLALQPSGAFVADPLRTNTFNNRQNVYAGYSTWQYAVGKWGVKAGLRLENTVVDADFISNGSQVKQNYFSVVPSVSFTRKFTSSSLTFGFTQRIQRPGINQLNPFIDRSNPNFETTGNPDLRLARANVGQLGYSWFSKANVSVNLSYGAIKGLIFPVSVYDTSTGITRTRYENTGEATAYMGNFNLSIPITPSWSLTSNASVTYGIARSTSNGLPIKNQGLMSNGNVSINGRLGKSWRLTTSGYFNGGNITVQARTKGYTNTSVSVTKDVVANKLSLSASASNPFSKFRTNSTHTFGPNYDQNNRNQQYFRSGTVSMNYRFGKLKEAIKKNKRGIRNDDVAN